MPRALDEAQRLLDSGIRDPDALEQRLTAFIASEPLAQPDVVAIRDPRTLERMEIIDRPPLLLLFVRFGTTRLLDNRVLTFHMPQ